MEDSHRWTLMINRKILVKDLNPDEIQDHIIASGILDADDFEKISLGKCRKERAASFLDLLIRRGPKAFKHFCDALQEKQNFLSQQLQKDAERLAKEGRRGTKLEVDAMTFKYFLRTNDTLNKTRRELKKQQDDNEELQRKIDQLRTQLNRKRKNSEELTEDIMDTPNTPKRRKLQVELVGYLSDVSETKQGPQKKYFSAKLYQRNSNVVRLLCFKPSLQSDYQKFSEDQTCVGFLNAKPMKDSKDDQTTYAVREFPYVVIDPAFDCPAIISDYQMTEPPVVNNVSQIKNGEIDSIITSTLFIKRKSYIEREKQYILCNSIAADDTGIIKLTLWNDDIEKVEEGRSYTFKGIRIKSYDDTIYIETKKSTVISESETPVIPIESTEEEENMELDLEELVSTVQGIDNIKIFYCCDSCCCPCNPDTSPSFVYCPNCKNTRLAESCVKIYKCFIQLNNNNKYRYTEEMSEEIQSEDDIKLFFLQMSAAKFTVMHQKIINIH